jgi:hypothetical protein
MDLEGIRHHLCLARFALGPEQPLSVRIHMVERNLTPGDPLWRDDAISAQTDLLAILTELEQLPEVIPSRVVSGAERIIELAQAEAPRGVNEAIKQIGDAIELL